jgi:solute carrier family 25 phosphate transporter 23/24/25/41
MQGIRQLARRLNPKVLRRVTPSVQQAPDKAKEIRDEKKQLQDYQNELTTKDEIAKLFQEMDIDGDGKLDLEDLRKALRKGRFPTSHDQMKTLFREIDTSGNGFIDFDEFNAFTTMRREKLHEAYGWIIGHRRSILEKQRGFTAGTFRTAAKKSGVHLSDSDVQRIMSHLDQDGTKHISYKEFVDCMLLAPEINPHFFLDSWYIDAFSDDASSEFTVPREIRVDDPESTSFYGEVAKKVSCGGTAGCLSRSITAPIDRMRILMMTSSKPLNMVKAFSVASDGGVMKLWMGNGASCMKIAPEIGIKLVSFDLIKNRIAQDPSNISVGERFLAGGLAGVISQLSIYPMEVLKTRLAIAHPGEINGVADCAHQIWKEGGLRAAYAGVAPSVVGILPYAAIDLSLNSVLREIAADSLREAHQENSVPYLLGCGMISSGSATVLTFPLNVIRTQAQASGQLLATVISSLKVQGWRAFYRGLFPCLVKVMPATSLSYVAYDYLGEGWDKTVASNKKR